MEGFTNTLVDDACNNDLKEKLAKASEEENFALKNRYLHNKLTMRNAKKEKMPIDSKKVRDVLRNQHSIRHKMHNELQTYYTEQNIKGVENGILTFVNQAAWGDLKELLIDIGINDKTIEFQNLDDLVEEIEEAPYGEDDYEANHAL